MVTSFQDRIRFSLLRVCHIPYRKRRIDNMVNPWGTIVFVKEGQLRKVEGGQVHQVRSGDVMIHHAHSPISIHADRQGEHLYMNLELTVAGRDLFKLKQLPAVVRFPDPAPVWQSFTTLLDRWNEPESAIRDMRVISAASDIISRLFETLAGQGIGGDPVLDAYRASETEQRSKFWEVLAFMENHLSEPLTCERLARIAHMHPSSFQKAFKDEYGVTPKLKHRQLRLEKARRLLENPSLTLEAIAHECGYCDAAYLIRIFQQLYLQTPGQYRQKLKVLPDSR